MRLFVIGVSGLLGLNVAGFAKQDHHVAGSYLGHPCQMSDIETSKVDSSDLEEIKTAIRHFKPDLILNTVALTDVDECQRNPKKAHEINVITATNAALAAEVIGAKLVHVSTDQVFDGTESFSKESSKTCPLNVYSETKLQAETKVLEIMPEALVVRTNFFGWGSSHRLSFSDWIIKGLEQQTQLTMFTDVWFTPILANHLVEYILDLACFGASGIINVGGANRLTKHDFALQLAGSLGYSREVIKPICLADLNLDAPRPFDMSMSCTNAEKILGKPMPSVEQGLIYLRRLKETGWPEMIEASSVPTTY